MKPGPRNSLTDVAGLLVGHAADPAVPRGVTVVLAPAGAVGGVDVRGAAPGTRETDILDPTTLVEQVHGVVLAGGSAFGLAAATGVVAHLAAGGHGFPTRHGPVPIVPAAVLFDLDMGGSGALPTEAWGRAAAESASDAPIPCGNVGAGAGATTGKLPGGVPLKGGLGTASLVLASGLTVAALVAVNAAGDVADPASRRLYAEGVAFTPRGGLDTPPPAGDLPLGASLVGSTTIGVVATDAPLTKAQAAVVARMAQDGIAQAVRPAHTMVDGDAVFVLATGRASPPPTLSSVLLVTAVGAAAADAVCLAIARAVRAAAPLPGWPAYRDWSESA